MTFPIGRIAVSLVLLGGVVLAGRSWLYAHPGYDPWAPLTLNEQPGWATPHKFASLRGDRDTCRAFLDRSGIAKEALAPVGKDQCRRDDRKRLAAPQAAGVSLSPGRVEATCAVDAGLAWWLRHGVQPQAEALLGSPVVRIEQLGTYNCRRIGNGDKGTWSEHATGNAIDVSAFVLEDGRRITVRGDWKGQAEAAAFLHAVRDSACESFSTVLSPDYNAAHADHLHLDQARRTAGWRACR
ncbi:extensin family protein [Novosphingobium aerophilum]|uniref:extensin-like domain-containing protein n=1 Tax=Novosphingobium TaxID=165696 RepID=UPI002D78F44D|nr:extensin family protein [Novosphingobium sp. RL4]WRT91983.1 extensin family protein [Novosphingobium sp. RL4]